MKVDKTLGLLTNWLAIMACLLLNCKVVCYSTQLCFPTFNQDTHFRKVCFNTITTTKNLSKQ